VAATAVLGEYGNLDKVYENLDAISELPIRGAKRVSRLLTEFREQAFLMRTLTTILCDVPVDIEIDGALIEESGLESVEEPT
jgi:DNA polymerase-1